MNKIKYEIHKKIRFQFKIEIVVKILTLCLLKFAMGMYSGQKPRLGIWALAQARTESTRIIFPNMSDDDLPRTPIETRTFIYIKQER